MLKGHFGIYQAGNSTWKKYGNFIQRKIHMDYINKRANKFTIHYTEHRGNEHEMVKGYDYRHFFSIYSIVLIKYDNR